MNRTITEATAKRFHYETCEQLRLQLADFMATDNFASRLKPLGGFTPYEHIVKIRTSEPDRFIVDLIHRRPGSSASRAPYRFSTCASGTVVNHTLDEPSARRSEYQ